MAFNGERVDRVLPEEELIRIMPIEPTPTQPNIARSVRTQPAWDTTPKSKIPSYVLCLPIKVFPQNLRHIETDIKLDEESLQALKLHILSLGSIKANAGYYWIEDEDDDDSVDEVEVDLSDNVNSIVTWSDIIV
jgi:hypothetical protein